MSSVCLLKGLEEEEFEDFQRKEISGQGGWNATQHVEY